MESASKSNRSSCAPQGNLSAGEFHQCPKGGHIAKTTLETLILITLHYHLDEKCFKQSRMNLFSNKNLFRFTEIVIYTYGVSLYSMWPK